MYTLFIPLIIGLVFGFGFTDVSLSLYWDAFVAAFAAAWPLLAAVIAMALVATQVPDSQRKLAWLIVASTYIGAVYLALDAFIGVTGWPFFLLLFAGNLVGMVFVQWRYLLGTRRSYINPN